MGNTSNNYNLQFGEKADNVNYDPKWFSDDAFCACESDFVVSLKPNQTDNDRERVNLFPNPTSGQFTIELPEYFSSPLTIEIFDLNGRLIETKTALDQKTVLEIESTGVFLVRIASSSYSEFVKVVVNR